MTNPEYLANDIIKTLQFINRKKLKMPPTTAVPKTKGMDLKLDNLITNIYLNNINSNIAFDVTPDYKGNKLKFKIRYILENPSEVKSSNPIFDKYIDVTKSNRKTFNPQTTSTFGEMTLKDGRWVVTKKAKIRE